MLPRALARAVWMAWGLALGAAAVVFGAVLATLWCWTLE